MAKFSDNTVLDAPLDVIATATRQTLTLGQPANFAGIAAIAKADAVMAPGDFTNSDDTSGRKVDIAAKAAQTVDVDGTDCDHVCLDDGTTLLYVTTCDLISVTAAGTVDFPTYKINFQDPT